MSSDAPLPPHPDTQPSGQPRKGMSRGCMVTLIVVGVLLILFIAASVVCYIKRDDIVRGGLTMGVNQVKGKIVTSAPQGVDTVWVAEVTEAFNAEVQNRSLEELQVKPVAMQQLGEMIQARAGDDDIDSAEAVNFVRAMIEVFPEELGQYRLPAQPSPEDTAASGSEDADTVDR